MTEQPDTAAIRASLPVTDGPSAKRTRALCDALDGARAERDEWKANTLANEALYLKHFNRAEAAEARIRELEQLADPELDARWCAVWQEVCAENDVLEARIAAAEENLTFAQQRAADNGLRAEIGEGKIRELVNEVHALKARIDAALEVLAEEPDWSQGRNAEVMFFGRDVFEALTGQ